MFSKQANSDTENGIKKNKKCPLEKSCTAETGKLENVPEKHGLSFQKILHFLAAGGKTPPP